MELEKLKSLLGLVGDEKDALLQFVIDDAEEIITSYCHVKEVPKGLKNTSYRMAVDLYCAENIGNESGSETVKSISQGDTSVALETSGGTDYKQSILKNYEAQLRKYRKLVW